jgi:hypothetical protein
LSALLHASLRLTPLTLSNPRSKGSNKFKAAIWDKTKGGKNIYLGSFTDELDAANAYDACVPSAAPALASF